MRDTTRHLPERAQTLLLHHGLASLAQILIRGLQCAVELRLMGGQGDVLAQLSQELAFAAAETMRLAPGSDEHPENPAFHQEWRCHHRTEPYLCQPLWKGKEHLIDVRLIDQLSPDAAGQAVLVDGNLGLLGQSEFHRKLPAVQTEA